jgi:hypothetical protein
MHNFTNEDLIRYIYNELNDNDRKDLEKELETNWALKEKLRVFKDAQNRVSNMRLTSPSARSMENIFLYAAGVSEPVER